ncbi:MAG: hypothetical protein FVQ80_04255 [Planctomycetes bacterium]|nr:hypothetical protein [Planctomycetota bacterium]
MNNRLAEILFLVMFGISLSASVTNVFKSIYPYGVGHVIKDGFAVFLIRVSFIAIMVGLSSLGFVLSLKFCSNVESKGVILDFINVSTILVLAVIPWLCDHITRILFLPFSRFVTIREVEFEGVDVFFIVIYLMLIGAIYLIHHLWESYMT